MRHLKWLVKLCFLWHVIKIIKSHGEMLSKESIFQLCKHPTAPRADASHVIKNISKVCYNDNDTRDGDDKIAKATANGCVSGNGSAQGILNIFEKIFQRFEKGNCESNIQREEHSEAQNNSKSVAQQRTQIGNQEDQIGEQRFSILQQLRLDEQKVKWQQHQQALKQLNILNNVDENVKLGKASKKKRKKKKKKKKKRKKKKKPVKNKRKKKNQKPTQNPTALLAHPSQVLFATPTQMAPHHYQQHDSDQAIKITSTTKRPFSQHPLMPIKKIKYILRKNTIFKKKKKEYLNHLKHVLYPFVKFIAFFTIINPFTLAAFLFSLASPVVFGFLGFVSLSFFIKPALNLLFGVKHTVDTIERRKLQQLRRRQRLRDSRRPITIHKHYYQQRPIASPPVLHRHHPLSPSPTHHQRPALLTLKPRGSVYQSTLSNRNPQHHRPPRLPQGKFLNPLLPDVRKKLKTHKYFIPDIKALNDSFEQF